MVAVVPDVSGIDRVFDYSVPERLSDSVRPGVKVRITLNGRRVSGWVVDVASGTHIDASRLVDIVSVSGRAVDEEVVPLTRWVSQSHWGPWRAVLASASAPRVRRRPATAMRTIAGHGNEMHASGPVGELLRDIGGLVVIPPSESVISLLVEVAHRGPMLVVCPTVRMARLGAAALRRHGLSTAEIPDEWERAEAGVDIVIGARGSVFAPCAGLSTIVVVDEHDEALQEERSPTWHARSVALERARRSGIPFLCTSSVPSAEASRTFAARTIRIGSDRAWPSVVVEDLADLPVQGSMLGERMLRAIGDSDRTTLCVLNTKGNARLLACRGCRTLQVCHDCGTALATDASGALHCPRCPGPRGTVCTSCGRTGFRVLAGGTAMLASDIRRSTGRSVVEVTGESDSWESGSVFVGTDALLHRVPRADTVVFCDVDRDVLAPHLSASREFLARVVRAARLVGAGGEIVLQTRMPGHPLLGALVSADVQHSLEQFLVADVEIRSALGLPPFSRVVRVAGAAGVAREHVEEAGVQMIASGEDIVVRGNDDSSLSRCLDRIRDLAEGAVRVYADPVRF